MVLQAVIHVSTQKGSVHAWIPVWKVPEPQKWKCLFAYTRGPQLRPEGHMWPAEDIYMACQVFMPLLPVCHFFYIRTVIGGRGRGGGGGRQLAGWSAGSWELLSGCNLASGSERNQTAQPDYNSHLPGFRGSQGIWECHLSSDLWAVKVRSRSVKSGRVWEMEASQCRGSLKEAGSIITSVWAWDKSRVSPIRLQW